MIWDTISGQLQQEVFLDFGKIYPWGTSAFSPAQGVFAGSTGQSWGDEIGIWDIYSGRLIGEPLPPAPDIIFDLEFSPNGEILVSSSSFASLRFFHVPTQKIIGYDLGFPNALEITFSQDGQDLLVLSDTGIFTIDIEPESWGERACRIVNRNFTQEEWQQYFPGEPYRETCDLDAIYVPESPTFSGADSPSPEISHTVILQDLSLAFAYPVDWEVPFRRDEIFLVAMQTGEEGLEDPGTPAILMARNPAEDYVNAGLFNTINAADIFSQMVNQPGITIEQGDHLGFPTWVAREDTADSVTILYLIEEDDEWIILAAYAPADVFATFEAAVFEPMINSLEIRER